MKSDWLPLDTGKHQDHVIAHVVGASALGYFEFDETAYILLDIGFIWTIYADGEMGLLPQSLAISELHLETEAKAELNANIQLLHDGQTTTASSRITAAPAGCLIVEVEFYANANRRRILIKGEEASLAVDSSLDTGVINIFPVLEGPVGLDR